MDALDAIRERAARRGGRVVLPEAEDPRVLRAASRLAASGVARPLLIGSPDVVRRDAHEAGVRLDGVELVDPRADSRLASCRAAVADALVSRFDSETALEAGVDELLGDRLGLAAALVRAGHADGFVSGAVHTTAETLRAALRVIRPARRGGIVSSFFLMGLREPTPAGESVLAFADCGLVPSPDVEQLAAIGEATAASFARLTGREARVAFLSFSTRGSASHADVDRVRRAAERLIDERPSLAVDGELQLDAALVPDVAARKQVHGRVAGRANVLIFPDLDAGNIGYKLVERLAGARAIGPLLQGLTRPANDLSRGCSVEDIEMAVAVTVLQAAGDDGYTANDD